MWTIRKLIRKGDYDYALVPEHPKATKNGYVLYHRVVVENSIGRLLTDNEEVHHIDRNRHNNNISNLLLLTKEAHRELHKTRKKTYVELKCPICNNIRNVLKRNSVDKNQYCCSRHCGRLFQLLSLEEQEKRKRNSILRIFKM